MKASPTSLRKIRTYTQFPDEDIFSGYSISSAFSEPFCFEGNSRILRSVSSFDVFVENIAL